MKMFYDKDINYFEIFFERSENYAEEIQDGVVEFRTESDDKVIGYGFDQMELMFKTDFLNSSKKLAALLFITRKKFELTQTQMATKLDLELRQYQRYESGENNTTLDTVDDLKKHLPEADFSSILQGSRSA